MCKELEKREIKMFQFFPLRTNIIPKYIPIDTTSIIELFITEHKNDYLTDVENCKDEIWNKYFKLDDKIFKQKNYTFDYKISTDCIGVSIQLLHNSFVESEKSKKRNKKNVKIWHRKKKKHIKKS